MKKMKSTSLVVTLMAVLALTLALPAFAGTEVTLTGEGKCAKCALHETDKCQTVIQTEENGKQTTYYLTQNKVSKDFHENLCENPHKVTATGTVKEVNGKHELTVSKIELVK
jgi:hypothetical protein